MATLSEILILNGALPIEHLDSMTGDEEIDDRSIRSLVDQGLVSEAQYITARAASNNSKTVPLTDYPVDGTAVSISQRPGDAVVYLGCQTPHWREPYPGTSCAQVFLHYVFAFGDRAYAYFDKKRTR